MKDYIILLLLTFSILTISAQNSQGKVTDSDTKEAIAGANIKLIGSNKEATTNQDGKFVIEGNGIIEISYIGYQKVRVNLTDIFLEISMKSTANELQSVEIVGRNAKKYVSDYSFSATKTAIKNKDLPQAVSTVTKELIEDRQAFQLADAVKMVSGVVPSSFYNQYNIRGISQNEEGQIINGMRTRQHYFLQPLTTNIERVEVVKGPASATFSSVDPGGSVNLVTKKPLATERKEVSFSTGSFATLRGTLDFTGPLDKDKTLLYRVNGAYQEARSYRDLVNNSSFLLSPSISYIPNEKTAINAEMIITNMNGNLDRGQPIFGAVAGVTNLNSTPISLNLGASNDFYKTKEFILNTSFSHKFTKNIGFNAQYMKQTWKEDLQEHRTTNAFAVDIANKPVSTQAAMRFVQRKQLWNVDNLSTYFNVDVETGSVKHKLLVGYDFSGWEKTKGGVQNEARGFLLTNGTVANTFVLANAANYQTIVVGGVTLPKPNVNHFDLANPTYTIRNTDDYNLNRRTALPSAFTTTNAVFFQENLQWYKLTVLLSVRYEWFKDITNYNAPNEKSFNNEAFLPRLSVSYAITDNINVYTSYLRGFQPQSNTTSLMPNTENFFNVANSAALFAPLQSESNEIGAKTTFFDGKIAANAAYFLINQRNLLQNANNPAFPDLLETRGAERSTGFEMDVTGFIQQNWQINLAYSYIDARIIVDNNPALVGARKQNTPFNNANLWTRYNFSNIKALQNLGIGFGAQHSGSKVPWFNRTFEVPAYTTMDMALYYNPGKKNMQLALNVNNITNETYWVGAQNYLRLFPGAPRNAMLTMTYKF
jgi:iron complex outermembrane receptor protein